VDRKRALRSAYAFSRALLPAPPWRRAGRRDLQLAFMTGLIKGQEQYLHVWTLGEKGVVTSPTSW